MKVIIKPLEGTSPKTFQVLKQVGIPATWGGNFSPDSIQVALFQTYSDARNFCKYWRLEVVDSFPPTVCVYPGLNGLVSVLLKDLLEVESMGYIRLVKDIP